MENRTQGRGKGKEETGNGNCQVLREISNRIAEGKQISRPITRNFHGKLLANEQTAEKLEVQANEQEAAQGNKLAVDNKAIVLQKHGLEDLTDLPNPEVVHVFKSEVEEKIISVWVRESRERSCRNVKSLTSEITAQSKVACRIMVEPEDQPEDIDVNDGNEVAAAEYLDDICEFYKLIEEEDNYRVSDYMKSQKEINELMRSITVDWMIDVHTGFKLRPETLFLTINIIDRYLSLTPVSKKELQLVGIGSMLIACKYFETWHPQVKDLISISAYTKDQILLMEKAILDRIKWYLTVPTPYFFLVRFIRASGQPDEQMENMVFFLAELSLGHYEAAISHRPSMTAAAAVYAARCTLKRRPFWNEFLLLNAGYGTEQIRDCAKLLISLHTRSNHAKHKAVFQKFSSMERGGVAFLYPREDIEKDL